MALPPLEVPVNRPSALPGKLRSALRTAALHLDRGGMLARDTPRAHLLPPASLLPPLLQQPARPRTSRRTLRRRRNRRRTRRALRPHPGNHAPAHGGGQHPAPAKGTSCRKVPARRRANPGQRRLPAPARSRAPERLGVRLRQGSPRLRRGGARAATVGARSCRLGCDPSR